MSEPSKLVPPKPEDFGLTADRVQFFTQRRPLGSRRPGRLGSDHPLLGLALVWIWLLGPAFLVSGTSNPVLNYLLILLGSILSLGFLGFVVLGLARAADWIAMSRKKRAPDYGQFLRFQAADMKHREVIAAAFAEEKADQLKRRRLEREEWQRRKDEARRAVAWWKSLSGHQFEKELCELFKSRGYDVRLTGFHGGDRGIDIVLKTEEKTIIVQCKAHRHYLSAGPVRELYGTLVHEKEKGRASEAWLICCSGFYSGAKDFAVEKPIRLLTIRDILEGKESRFL